MKLIQKKKQNFDILSFESVRISLNSPENIKELSYGEVKKTETLNYKSLRPERDGLFCEKIFGPIKDFECSCGKHKKSLTTMPHTETKQVCDRCGVPITSSSVRRERMGHINLVIPVAHYWFFGKSPSKVALVLDMMQEEVRDVVYGISWVVVEKLDDVRDCVVETLRKVKSDILEVIVDKDREEISVFFDKVIEAAKIKKVSLERKFVLSGKNVIKYFEDHSEVYDFIKLIKDTIKKNQKISSVLLHAICKIVERKLNETEMLKELIKIISLRFIDVLTDEEKYIGIISNSKNYLTAKVLTNAEAIWRLLRDEDLEKSLREIKKQLEETSQMENIIRIKALFNIYLADQKKFVEDFSKIEKILSNIGNEKLLNMLKDKDETFKLISEMSDTIVKLYNGDKLSIEIMHILYELFGKYNIEKTVQIAARSRLITRFKIIESFISNNIRPEWMILQVLPILPPDLRPLVAIEGGKFASSDLNELYRRVIHRNNRLKKFCGADEKGEKKELFAGTPKLIILNEKRLLQEAVDALIENSAKKHPIINNQKRPLKSLTDILKGKQGRFRQNLLGKRVDYSGRSVIVVGPELKLYQCGLPKEMAFELFKPYILYKIIKKFNVSLKKAKVIAERRTSEVWDILEETIKHHPVLLNRAPTLHRPSIEAFEPVLVEGKAIKIHPLVCTPFNADFDGDQMAVYVPLTLEAITEAKLLMMSYHNLFSPANGRSLIGPTQDIVLGVGYLTTHKDKEKGEGLVFSSQEEALLAYEMGYVALNAKIKIRNITKINDKDSSTLPEYTTVGRVIFNSILPEELRFKNIRFGKKELFNIVQECYNKCGKHRTVVLLDDLKKLGYHYATICGFTISIDDMIIPPEKSKHIQKAWKKVREIEKQAQEGIITEKERYNSIVDTWSEIINEITDDMIELMKQQEERPYKQGEPRFNSVYFMAKSGARGNMDQVKQLSAIRGLMSRPQRKISGEIGEIIETPVLSNFREGLNILEYFISTHGGRKGLSDTALKTSEAGYLTRRLVDVAHHVVVTQEDCGTINRIKVSALKVGDDVIESLKERITGRVAAEDITYEKINEKNEIVTKIIKAGEMITEKEAEEIEKLNIFESIPIRAVLTCEAKNGVCAKCYGMDMSTGELVKVGEAVGVVAAQSIGEPGTQLTLRTFHIGGAASTLARKSSIRAPFDGEIEYRVSRTESEKNREGDGEGKTDFGLIEKEVEVEENGVKKKRRIYIVISSTAEIRLKGQLKGQIQTYGWELSYGSRLYVKEGEVKKDQLIADWDAYSIPVITTKSGKIRYSGLKKDETYIVETRSSGVKEIRVLPYRGKLSPQLEILDEKNKVVANYQLPADSVILVEDGEEINKGDVIAKIPREEIKTKDITAGLPRIEELFEARHPQNLAILSEIDGVVHVKTIHSDSNNVESGQKKAEIIITVRNEKSKQNFDYKIPPGRFHLVQDGDKVEAGEPLTDGVIDPHKYLAIRGAQHLQEFLLNEIQEVYRLQGVSINDKHIEVIIKQMLSFVRIIDPGHHPDTSNKTRRFYEFIYGEIVPRKLFEEEIKKYDEEIKELKKDKKVEEIKKIRLPKAEPILLGISAVASTSESFLSAASFQETSRILTQAALECKVDHLNGLKENVIIGHLIPAGTGFYEKEAALLRKEEKMSQKLLEV